MTPADRLERDLPDLLAEVVVPAPSADLTATLERIAVVRQRPAWTLLERWIPLDITDQSLTLRGRAPALRPIVLVVIMALVILAGFLLYVGSRPKVPPPFGPARNGVILIQTDPDFDIVAVDPATGAITTLIAGPTSPDFQPMFSPDGRRFLYIRDDRLYVANADGSGSRELIATGGWSCGGALTADWSLDPDQLVLSGVCHQENGNQGRGILDLDDGTWAPLPRDGRIVGRLATTDQFVVISERKHLSLVNADGAGGPVIATWPQSLEAWTMSPDGSKFAYMTYGGYWGGADHHPHILDVGSGTDRRLDMEGGVIQFSPDGTKVLVEVIDRSVPPRDSSSQASPPTRLAILPLDGSPEVAIDLPSGGLPPDALAGLMFSPDGTLLLATYPEGDDATGPSRWLFDIVSGDGRQVFWPATTYAISDSSWQRLAP